MNSVFDALGGTRYVRTKMFGEKHKDGLAPLYSREIKKLREKRQLTQKELAELSGISESDMRSYELGDRKPKKDVLEHIAMALRVRPEYLSVSEFVRGMEFFYALLENDEMFGYTITEINGRPVIAGGLMTASMTFDGFLRDWNEIKLKLDAKEITREEYEDWKGTYDLGHWMNTPDGKSPWTGK